MASVATPSPAPPPRFVKFVLSTQDDQADPRTGTTVAQKLVDDGIKGMLGHFNSGTTIPASRIYANAGIPEIAMATAPEYTTQGFKTAFRMMTSDTQQGSVAGEFAVVRTALPVERKRDGRSVGERLLGLAQFGKAQRRFRDACRTALLDQRLGMFPLCHS